MDRWISLAAVVFAVAACSGPSTAGSASDPAPDELDEEARRLLEAEIIEADRAFARDVERHGLGGWLENFAPSGRMVAGGESYIGQEGIRRAMLPLFADTTVVFDWDPTYAEVASSGDLGYTIGTYELTSGADGTADRSSGTYLTVWRRQPDGRWKVQADIGNPAPEGPSAPD